MTLFSELIQINLFFIIFSVIHSLTASNFVKLWFKSKFNYIFPFYRAFYNLLSLITFFLFWKLSPKPDVTIFDLVFPFDMLFLLLQILSIIGLIYIFKFIDYKEFLGMSQIKRFFDNEYSEELDERYTLRIEGPYKYSRHPIYFFMILFLIFYSYYTLFYLNFLLCSISYFYIGTFFEEKRMLALFGTQYRNYQKNVPRIIPNFWKKR